MSQITEIEPTLKDDWVFPLIPLIPPLAPPIR